MIAAPAVDIRGGRCVQLVGGDPAAEVVALPDPVAVAQRWRALGFAVLHVVDLDAALGSGSNLGVVERILAATSAEVQVGGGVRDEAAVQRLWDAGARRAIVGLMVGSQTESAQTWWPWRWRIRQARAIRPASPASSSPAGARARSGARPPPR